MDTDGRLDEHDKRIRVVEQLLVSADSNQKWFKVIGAGVISAICFVGWLTVQQGVLIASLGNDHQASEVTHVETHDEGKDTHAH